MANKNEQKNDSKDPKAGAASATPDVQKAPPAEASKTVALTTAVPKHAILSKDPDQLMTDITLRMQGLMALLDDSDIPADMKEKLGFIIAQARPDKPGMEEVDAAWTLPRLSIVQPTTQANAKPEAAKPGDVYTSAGQIVERPFGFIPVFFHYENIMFIQGEKVPQCYSPDAKTGSPFGVCLACPNLPFGLQNGGKGDQKPTECQNNIVAVAVSFDMSTVAKIQFGKTSRGAGSALLALARANPFPWKQSYLLETEKKTGDKGTYYVYKTSPTGRDNDAPRVKIAKALNELFTASRQKALYDFYARVAQAPAVAAAAEGAFQGGKLDAGLGDGVEPDLSTPPPAAGTARTAAKPM